MPLLKLSVLHTLDQERPSERNAATRRASTAARGRPNFLPFARALRRPARTRSWISARSNSAIAPIIWNISRPDGVREIQIVAEADKRDPVGAKIGKRVDEVLQRATKTIDLPYQHGVELPPVGVGHELRSVGSRFFRAGAP